MPAEILYRQVAEVCVFGPHPCPMNSGCRMVIARLGRKLSEAGSSSDKTD